jgi:hypothetical protein
MFQKTFRFGVAIALGFVKATNFLIKDLTIRFIASHIMDAMGIIYPQY